MVASLLSALLTAFLKSGSSGILIVIGEHFLTCQFDIFTPFSDESWPPLLQYFLVANQKE